MVSGNSLSITKEGLATPKGLVVKFAKRFCEYTLQLEQKGYNMTEAKVNFIVYWFNKETGKEVKVILPELGFAK